MSLSGLRPDDSDAPRVLVVDGSKVVRRLIEQVLRKDLPDAEIVACATGVDARRALHSDAFDLVITALRLPDMDGQELARYLRESAPQAYIPLIVVSGDVQERLVARTFTDEVTDYFDKSLGYEALAAFIRGYVRPEAEPGGEVLYVEDSRVVAAATRRMLEKHGLAVTHATSVDEAIEALDASRAEGRIPGPDIVLTDIYLKGGQHGKDLLLKIREGYGYAKAQLPVLVMTGDANPANQSELLRLGANDLVVKPIEEARLVAKLLFQLRVGRILRAKIEA